MNMVDNSTGRLMDTDEGWWWQKKGPGECKIIDEGRW